MFPIRSRLCAAIAATLTLLLAACADPAPRDDRAPMAVAAAPTDADAASPGTTPAPDGGLPADAGALPADESVDTATAGVPDAALAVPTPAAGAVLDAIFGTVAAGATADERTLADGRFAAFWQGQIFARDGAGWYVGFAAVATPKDDPAPDDGVMIAQATWRFADGAWQPVSSAEPIGRFGGRGRAPMPDGAQDARVHALGDRVLLAMPTAETASAGVVVHAFELFAGEGEPLAWRHVGRLPAGSDNRDACSDMADSTMPCASASGTLEFVTPQDGAVAADAVAPWPTLRLSLQGTVIVGPGEVRETTPEDVVELRFDAASGQYLPARPIPDAAL